MSPPAQGRHPRTPTAERLTLASLNPQRRCVAARPCPHRPTREVDGRPSADRSFSCASMISMVCLLAVIARVCLRLADCASGISLAFPHIVDCGQDYKGNAQDPLLVIGECEGNKANPEAFVHN